MATPVKLNKDNVYHVLNYGPRLFTMGRLVDASGKDVISEKDALVVERYEPNVSGPTITKVNEKLVVDALENEELTLYLVGAAMQVIYVKKTLESEPVKVVGIDPFLEKTTVVASDIYAQYSYLLNMTDKLGQEDDIDQLGNRRIRTVGELIQNQFRIGLPYGACC